MLKEQKEFEKGPEMTSVLESVKQRLGLQNTLDIGKGTAYLWFLSERKMKGFLGHLAHIIRPLGVRMC